MLRGLVENLNQQTQDVMNDAERAVQEREQTVRERDELMANMQAGPGHPTQFC